MESPLCHPFSAVLRDELDAITRRRHPERGEPAAPRPTGEETAEKDPLKLQAQEEKLERDVQEQALQEDLLGLALSGGGIRSATFALGVLQALASEGLIRRLDYLSTVSGGGYIGSWLAAWIRREGVVERVEEQLIPSRRQQAEGRTIGKGTPYSVEPEPICHLRAYSSYLAPKRGIFSADSLVLVAVYLRNLLLNQAILLPLIAALLLVPRLFEPFYQSVRGPFWDGFWVVMLFASLEAAVVSVLFKSVVSRTAMREWANKHIRLQLGVRLFHALIVVPLFLFAVLSSCNMAYDLAPPRQVTTGATTSSVEPSRRSFGKQNQTTATTGEQPRTRDPRKGATGKHSWWTVLAEYLPWQPAIESWEETASPASSPHLSRGILFGTIWGIVLLANYVLVRLFLFVASVYLVRVAQKGTWRSLLPGIKTELAAPVAALLAGFAGGALLYLVFGYLLRDVYQQPYGVALLGCLGAPFALMVIMLAITLAVGCLGTTLGEDSREWWGSLCGWLLMDMIGWTVVVGLSLFGPLLLLSLPGWGQAILGTGWITMALSGVLAGKSSQTGTFHGNRALEWLVLLAPPVFLVGLLTLMALVLDAVQSNVPPAWGQENYPALLGQYFQVREVMALPGLLLTIGVLVIVAYLVSLRVDVNAFSLTGLYANRLIRCYLGASRPKERKGIDRQAGAPANSPPPTRQPDPVTGFDPEDDFPLAQLHPNRGYRGPYPLINTALNLLQGDELAWQERKADAFVLSPAYCGSRSTGYRPLNPENEETLRLGLAVALSGAAVSPNMGYHSSPAVTALLTLFNVRLGGWLRNPNYGEVQNTGPRFGPVYLLNEMFGRTNKRSSYVYLSDGGHFENLGVFELVRRRCRCIVVSDGEQDDGYLFDGLASTVRKCRTDLGVDIEIDTTAIRPKEPGGRSSQHWAIGKIHYDLVHPDCEPGVLIYLKSSLTGDEPADVRNFGWAHPQFPHQSTANQMFTESQFESYRALGLHVAEDALNRPEVREALGLGGIPGSRPAPAEDREAASVTVAK